MKQLKNWNYQIILIKIFEMEYEGKIYERMSTLYSVIRNKFNYTDTDFDLDERLFTLSLKGYSLTINEKKILLRYKLKDKNQRESKLYYEEFKKIKFTYSFVDLYGNPTEGSCKFSEYY